MAKWKNASKVNRVLKDKDGQNKVIKPKQVLEIDLSEKDAINAPLIRDGHVVQLIKKKKADD